MADQGAIVELLESGPYDAGPWFGMKTVSDSVTYQGAVVSTAPALVVIIRRADMRILDATMSDNAGNYVFQAMQADEDYIVIGVDKTGVFNVVAYDRVRAG